MGIPNIEKIIDKGKSEAYLDHQNKGDVIKKNINSNQFPQQKKSYYREPYGRDSPKAFLNYIQIHHF